jgi:RNA polymerase sigma-54 factor
MKPTISTQLGQQLHLTPHLLQSIRLLQLNGVQLELEIRQALENNPLLELEEFSEPEAHAGIGDDPAMEVAAFDELPESSLWDVHGSSWNNGDDDRTQRVAATASSDPHVRLLSELALEMDEKTLALAAFWLENSDDAGYLCAAAEELAALAAQRCQVSLSQAEAVRQRCKATWNCWQPTTMRGSPAVSMSKLTMCAKRYG